MAKIAFIIVIFAIIGTCNGQSSWWNAVSGKVVEEEETPDPIPRSGSSEEESRRASFGQSCDEWIQCDPLAWLQCKDNRCDCMTSDMTYDPRSSKCVARASKQCRYGVGHLGDTTMVFRVVDCIENSVCTAGICTCIAGMYETPNGTCAALKEFGEACEASIECSKERGLACVNGSCVCNGSKGLIYSQDRDECIAQAGKRCRHSSGVEFVCTENAYCGEDGLCTCSTEFYVSPNGSCDHVKDHREQCQSSSECDLQLGLSCYDGVCDCDRRIAAWGTNTWETKCFGLEGSSCEDDHQCLAGSYCNVEFEVCLCQSDYVADPQSRICVPKRNLFESCKGDFECEQDTSSLRCIDSKCQCDPERSIYATLRAIRRPQIFFSSRPSRYDEEPFTGCVPLPGFPCHEGLCAPNSYCNYPSPSSQGTCKCDTHMTFTRNRTCEPGYSQPCGSGCMDGLVCKNGICGCKRDDHSQGYDAARQSCYSKVGGPCKGNDDCGHYATCTLNVNSTGSSSGGHCECSHKFVRNAQGDCVAMAGGLCGKKDDCDTIAGLNCVEGKCECPNFGLYDSGLRKCRGKAGSVCSMLGSKECIVGAECSGDHLELPGRCRCTSAYTEDEHYNCV